MQKIKNIIFDYGNVIFAIDFRIAQKTLTQIGISNIEDFFGHKGHHTLFDDLETGSITPAQFREGIRLEAKNPALTDAEIDAAWNSLLIGIAPQTLDVLNETKKHYRTFLLSNTNQIHFNYFTDYLKREFQVEGNDHLFEKTYYSHEMLMRKPNVEIFEQVIRENNLNPAETLFIDDSPQHLVGAKEAGLQTLLMTEHPKDLGSFLKDNGILV
ncbi:putative hydrolase of the HAD superfamily [Pedobacter westerhofensis]|uniref:Putative hydrolase of the HAD superfamily n=1 Tax=Pedobacter westerhofensis TaxID=425512 RepID=A0A521AYK2_9SPHI|nr:HAD family phosphatase [Pedobacter westerhofensis]SMO39896.1 putative hydrolase of the HAD superfamily [Pedobacter westerhofensis]